MLIDPVKKINWIYVNRSFGHKWDAFTTKVTIIDTIHKWLLTSID